MTRLFETALMIIGVCMLCALAGFGVESKDLWS